MLHMIIIVLLWFLYPMWSVVLYCITTHLRPYCLLNWKMKHNTITNVIVLYIPEAS